MLTVSSHALTHTGLRRPGNEDSAVSRQGLGLFGVCDGMGGHAAGEVASKVAADAIESFIQFSEGVARDFTWPFGFRPGLGIDGNRLVNAFLLANRAIAQRTQDEPELQGMATTAVVLLLADGPWKNPAGAVGADLRVGPNGLAPSAQRLAPESGEALSGMVAHVGDSRAYHWRDGVLEPVTRDHSWVEEQIANGALTPEDARTHPWRNLVTRALAGSEDPLVELTPVVLERGDRLLLCSDGLTTPLTDEMIGSIVSRAPRGAVESLCQALVDAANAAGGPDNITVVVVEVQ